MLSHYLNERKLFLNLESNLKKKCFYLFYFVFEELQRTYNRRLCVHLPAPAFFKLTTVYSDAKNCGLSVAAKDTPDASSEFL